MLNYLLRRIFLFIPTLLVISVVAFIISISTPVDPVERLLNISEGTGRGINASEREHIVNQKRHDLGLDLPFFYFGISTLEKSSTNMNTMKRYIPSIHLYGFNNQYHRWLSGIILRGDFGISYRTQLPVMDEIKPRLPWSLILSLLSVILAFVVSIPIGMYAARFKGRLFDKVSGLGLFMFYSLPNFFVATLLLVFFANPQFLNWFPESGVQDAANYDPNWPLWIKVQHWLPYLILPVITYTYSSIAYLGRQMRASAVEVYGQEFIKTARAKGLSENRILWKHIFRNSLLPMITIFAHVFPSVIVGSIIIETIFALPGMGREIYEAILSYDYPVIIAVFTLFGFLTLLGYLISDILYAVADPRISYSK